ncbi:unnamed protein product [Lymnaea stagnalis]|uniref:Uncharacterized protein n=1 Tax=Lymnaea stagnalis TaxID=6523 RepID=A0AAV2HIQ0_LYMST
MARTVVLGFHLIVFIIDLYALYYDFFVIDLGHKGFGGKFKFLTFWNICLQTFYFGFSVANDISKNEESPRFHNKRSPMQRWRDNFHAAIAFPVGMFVVATFWGLYAIDRDLVYPKALDKIIPPLLNHVLHSTVLPFLLVDKALVYHHYPKRFFGMLGTLILACFYLLWILFIAFYDNFWVYPVLQVLKTHERAIFMSSCLLLFAPLYIMGEKISTYFWCKQSTAASRIKRN